MASASDSDWETDSSTSGTRNESDILATEFVKDRCANCKKTETEISKPLKRCVKCHTQRYCSRECQTADWRVHKLSCGSTQPSKASIGMSPDIKIVSANALKGLGADDYLHQFAQRDAFHQLIDCYRLRIEDDYTFSGDAGGLYAGENPLPDFRRFLTLAQKRQGLLPKWWTPAKRMECERLAMNGKQFSNLKCAVEKSDVVEHYGDPLMPLKLRALAEKVYGREVGFGGW